jgi:hypothetical protein
LAEQEPSPPAERVNLACFEMSREVTRLAWCVPEAGPLARTLLRVVGRVVIDSGAEGADPAGWTNTEAMALRWIDEAIRPLGYEVRPRPGSGRPEPGEADGAV